MTRKPGLKGRSKSIKAAMAAASAGDGKADGQAKAKVKVKAKAKAKVTSPTVRAVLSAAQMIPSDPDSVRILEDRAEIYARPPRSKRSAHGGQAYVKVGLGGTDSYGIPFSHADEIVLSSEITQVPGTPPHIAGVVNLRGTLLTVIDLNLFLGINTASSRKNRQIVVVSGGGMRFGILVARVDGSVSYVAADLDPSVGGTGKSGRSYVSGIHAGNVAVLDMLALTDDPALTVDQPIG